MEVDFIKKKILILSISLLIVIIINFIAISSAENNNITENIDDGNLNNKIDTSISSHDMYVSEKNHNFNVSLSDINGNMLVNQSIIFNINGIDYNADTDEKGIAKLNINLNIGNYEITTKYQGNSFYNSILVINNIYIRDNSTIFIFDQLTNTQIQNIIDSAKKNSNIEFIGKEYNNIQLTISKSLNLISYAETRLNGVNSSSVLTFSAISSGKLSGFKISNGLNGIQLNNVSNFIILNNSITGNINGILLNNTFNITISENIIQNNFIGINLLKSSLISIINNNITNNSDGIYFDMQNEKITIELNNISYNKNFGININENNFFIDIYRNNITFNGLLDKTGGINLNGSINDLNIESNLIASNFIGMYFGNNYIKDSELINVNNNAIIFNQEFEILARDSIYQSISIGSNYFGGDDYTFLKICYKIQLSFDFIIPFSDENGKIIFGSNPSALPVFTISYSSDGKKWDITTVKNGILNVADLNIGGEDINIQLRTGSSNYILNISYNNESVDFNNNTSNPNEKKNSSNQSESNITVENNGFNGREIPSNNIPDSGDMSSIGENMFLGFSNVINVIANELSDYSRNENAGTSKKGSTSSETSKKSVSKKIEINDEIIRILGLGNLIILLIIIIGVYYSKDIKEMLIKRKNDL